MKYRLFHYPFPCDQELSELNQFLASHRITLVRHFVVRKSESPLLTFLVEYVDCAMPVAPRKATKVDYRELLNDEQFLLYSRLRDLRKEIAEAEVVPLYTLFTNVQLADIAVKRIQTVDRLREIGGLGTARIQKYGERLVAIVRDVDGESGSTK